MQLSELLKSKFLVPILAGLVICFSCKEGQKEVATDDGVPRKQRILILDGQNNHYVWPKTTQMMKDYLEDTELFEVSIHRMDSVWLGIKYNKSRPEPYTGFIEQFPVNDGNQDISHEPVTYSDFDIDFTPYDAIITNLGFDAAEWPLATQRKFEAYMQAGGGLVVVHAANNAWGQWEAYNEMIALGAWVVGMRKMALMSIMTKRVNW